MNDQASSKYDEQAVIAAVQLLVQSMEPPQREMLLARLAHGQRKNVVSDEVQTEENMYPIQPLILTTDESQRVAPDEQPSSAIFQHSGEDSSEWRRGAGKLLELYTALPFASSSLRRARWWTRLVLSAILLCVLSLSTFAAYQIGVHTGSADAAAQASACQGTELIVLEGRSVPFIYYPDRQVIVTNDTDAPSMYAVRSLPHFASSDGVWYIVQSHGPQALSQCSVRVQMIFPSLPH